MSLLETIWFLLSIIIILIVMLVDPKNYQPSSNTSNILGSFSNSSSGQEFIYNFSTVLILVFFVLTPILSLQN